MEDVKNFETYTKKVKFIMGDTAEEVIKKSEDFEKDNKIIDIIQKNEKLMIIFYWGKEKNDGGDNI